MEKQAMRAIRNLLSGLVLVASLGMSAAQAETVIHYGHPGPDKGSIPAALNWFNKRIGELSDGDLRMEIQWGNLSFKARDVVHNIGEGVVDAGSVVAAYYKNKLAAYSLADYPISGTNAWVALKATDKFMRSESQVTESLAHSNLVYMGTFAASAVNVACVGEPIRSIADIKGRRVRGAGVYGKVFEDLGATNIELTIYEVYKGLDKGLINCTQGYNYVVPALSWDEVIDSYTLMNWGQIGGYGMFLNKDVYDALSAEQQSVLTQAGEELTDEFANILNAANDQALQAMRDGKVARKIEVVELSDADRIVLNKTAEAHIEDWKKNARSVGLKPEKLLKAFTSAVAEFTAEYEKKKGQ